MKKNLLCLLLAALTPVLAHALSDDKTKPIEVTADHFAGDEVKQTAVYSGNVVVTQGSMNMTGKRLELRISAKGYRQAELTGGPAHFKQRNDPKTPGVDEWVRAHANRIVYNEENDTVTLTGNARLSRTENGVEKDFTQGERIVYDMRNARSSVEGGVVNGQRQRVSTVIAPRAKPQNEERPKTKLQGADKLSLGKKE